METVPPLPPQEPLPPPKTHTRTKTGIKLACQIIALIWICLFITAFLGPLLSWQSLSGYMLLQELIVVAPYFFLACLFLEKPVSLVRRFRDYLNKRRLFWKFSVYGLISLACSATPFIFLMTYLPTILTSGQDPFTAVYNSNGHWLVWTILTFVVVALGWKDILKGIFGGAFIYATHEASWIVQSAAQFSRVQYTGEPYQNAFFGVLRTMTTTYMPLVLTIITILAAYFWAWRVFSWKRELLIIIVPAIWGIIGLIVNFPNTLVLGYQTVYFDNPLVNAVEVLMWVIPALVAILPDTGLKRLRAKLSI